jgi:hypothetical protein
MKKIFVVCVALAFSATLGFPQSSADFQSTGSDSSKGGIIDLKKLKVNHSVSFGMASFGSGSPLMSQGLYTTMLSYRFSQPVTLNLNFGFPLMSTFSQAQNLNAQNIQSLEYFRNMPIDMSLTWQPKPNLFFNLSVVRNGGYGYGYGYSRDPFMPIYFPEMNRSADAANAATPK